MLGWRKSIKIDKIIFENDVTSKLIQNTKIRFSENS